MVDVHLGQQKYVVDKLIFDNGFDNLKKQLAELLFETNEVSKRWDSFLKQVKGMEPAAISELLEYADPQEYIIFNKTTAISMLLICQSAIINAPEKYVEVRDIAKQIAA